MTARGVVEHYGKVIVPLRENVVRLSQEQYDAMLLGVYQLIQAKQNEFEAYREYIESLRDYWIARSDLERAIGGRVGAASKLHRGGRGRSFEEVGTDGGDVPKSSRRPETTVSVPVGTTRTVELVANVEGGDSAFHCHKSHHTMNAMGHDVPNMLGVKTGGALEERVRGILPGYMAMGEKGMGSMMEMGRPKNTLPMMTGEGPYGPVEMGGMFTILKVREGIKTYADPGWYKNPPGTMPRKVESAGKDERDRKPD